MKCKLCGKACAKCGKATFCECTVLSRTVFAVPPFYSEEIIKTAKGRKKITTFLTFIRVVSIEPRSGGK